MRLLLSAVLREEGLRLGVPLGVKACTDNFDGEVANIESIDKIWVNQDMIGDFETLNHFNKYCFGYFWRFQRTAGVLVIFGDNYCI